MASARVVITDSGGIQEETSFLGIPCLTLRPNTERPVTVTLGTNTVVGEDLGKAEALVDAILAGRYKTGAPIPLWDGHAAERVVDVLARAWLQ
jgi:UDP-N-acetylglucosamine 2-epimerase (non-hydrolysing)